MIIILGLITFGLVYWYLTKDVVSAPPPMTEEELEKEGLSKLETRRELRAQRRENRMDSLFKGSTGRTANMLAKSIAKGLTKKKSRRDW